MAPPEILRFHEFVLDVGRFELRRRNRRVRLERKPMELLILLVRGRGELVTHARIVEHLWGPDVFVEVEPGIHTAVRKIRQALHDPADVPRFVETVTGKGYRFAAPVEAGVPAETSLPPVSSLQRTREPARRPFQATRRRTAVLLIPAVVLLAGAVAGDGVRSRRIVRISPHETLDADARSAYDAGQSSLDSSRTQVNIQEARRHFEDAVKLDGNFAAAHAALANTLTMLSAFGIEPARAVLPRARQLAARAVDLDPTLAAGWQALAHTQVQWEWDFPAAEQNYRRALALDPQGRFNFLFAHLLAGLGRVEEAVTASDRVRAASRDAIVELGSNCIVKYLARRYDGALEACTLALERQPGFTQAHYWRALVLVERGALDEAMADALASARPMANAPAWVVGVVHARAGRHGEAREVMDALERMADTSHVPAVDIAFLHAALGDTASALDWLDRGYQQRSRWMELLAVHPAADPLRGHVRFTALLRALGLPELSSVSSASSATPRLPS